MKIYNLGFLGFGKVGRALGRLLLSKSGELGRQGIEWRVTGISSRGRGWLSKPDGFDVRALLLGETQDNVRSNNGIAEWLQSAQPDVVFETMPLNHKTGQPAIEYLSEVLRFGAHAITANKGTVVFGFENLNRIANSVGKYYRFESTVLDGAPLFSLFRETLPAVRLRGFGGIFNSTTNVIIETMEAGRTFDEGLRIAEELGLTETDPGADIDGWDATVKVCALARVLMNIPLEPSLVRVQGIRGLTTEMVQAACKERRPFKLVARARLSDDGSVSAVVKPEQLSIGDPFANVRGTSLLAHFELDMLSGLTIISHRPNLQSTAYGLLSDFLSAVK